MAALGNLVDIRGGGTPSRKVDEYWGGDIPWVTVKDFKSTRIKGAQESITQSGIDNSATNLIPAGNIIVPTRMALGKAAINEVDVAINQDLKALLIKDIKKLHPQYLLRYLETKSVWIERQGKGATVKGITVDVLRDLEIPLPSLPIQKQIAAVLEKADTLRSQCKQMEQELNQLAQSVFLEMFGDPVTNPNGWEISDLKGLTTKYGDGPFGSNLKSSHYVDTGVRVIRLQNIGVGVFKDTDKAFISEEHYESLVKFTCKPGDIIVATLGNPNLRACLVPSDIEVAINKADCIQVRANEELVLTEFLVSYLNTPSCLKLIENKLHGQTRTRISSGQLAELEVYVPPLKHQQEYLDAYRSIENNIAINAQLQQRHEEQFLSLMHRAFKGELNLTKAA